MLCRVHRVVDCSETGFRYAPADERFPDIGSTVEGTLDFRGTEELEVKGTVVRIQAGEIAVHCGDTPIPLGVILREQRYLRVHFPFRQEEGSGGGSPATDRESRPARLASVRLRPLRPPEYASTKAPRGALSGPASRRR